VDQPLSTSDFEWIASSLLAFLTDVKSLVVSDMSIYANSPLTPIMNRMYLRNRTRMIDFDIPRPQDWLDRAAACDLVATDSFLFGDFWPSSILVDVSHKRVAIIDWELARTGHFGLDLTQMMANLALMGRGQGYNNAAANNMATAIVAAWKRATSGADTFDFEAAYVKRVVQLSQYSHWGLDNVQAAVQDLVADAPNDGEKSVADTPIGTTVSSSSVSPMLPTSSSTTYTNGNTERKNQINGAADASSSSIADHSTTADVKERPPSLLKLVIPAHEAAREGLTSVSSSSDPSSSSSISSPDSVSSSHSRSGLLSDPSSPHNATTDQPLDKKRTYSAHELHSWDSSAKSGGPPSFNRSVTASSVDRKHSLQSSMGPPPSFGLVSTSLQVEIQAVTLPADGIKEVEDDKSTHTVFALEVRLVSGLRWVIEKRYSDFRDFHDRMKKANASVRNLPFPKKHYFRGKSHSVIEQRRLDLERYVKDILHVQPLMKMPIFNFLAVYAHLESYDRKKRRQQKEVDLKRMKNLLAPDELADVQAAFQRLCTSKATAIASVTPPSSKQPTPQPTTTATTNSNINSPKSPAVLAPTLGPAADASTYADGGGGPSTSSSSISSSSSSAASSSADNNLMSKTAFRRDVLSVFPDMPSTFAIRFMKGFSDKSSNDISVDEFVRAVAILRHGSTDDQLLFSFNMCDHDHLGKLQSTGLSNLLVSLYGRPVIDKPEYKRVVNDLFDYGRTRLTADEFVHAMLTQPLDHVALVLDWMPSFMHILCETASPSLLELQEDYNPVVQQKILENETAFSAAEIAMLQDAFAMYRSGGSSSSATSSTSHTSTS
ncbi:hypothetical protein DYB25_013073, partial [Aphanomyces astaci]